jgi:hypothetical protein
MITPKTKVGELLGAYPALEEVLLEISPVFAKLKNPILRRTVAKVATLQQAAIIGNMPVEDLVNRLRVAAGQSITALNDQENAYLSEVPPAWYDPNKVVSRFNATAMINAGDSPMNEVLHKVRLLNPGDILELITPFIPAPIIELMLAKGCRVWTFKSDNQVSTYIIGL